MNTSGKVASFFRALYRGVRLVEVARFGTDIFRSFGLLLCSCYLAPESYIVFRFGFWSVFAL